MIIIIIKIIIIIIIITITICIFHQNMHISILNIVLSLFTQQTNKAIYTVENLLAKTKYKFRVAAVTLNETSSFSNWSDVFHTNCKCYCAFPVALLHSITLGYTVDIKQLILTTCNMNQKGSNWTQSRRTISNYCGRVDFQQIQID